MIHWGIIGAGNIAHRFATSLSHDNRAKLYAVACRTLKKAAAFQEEFPCEKIYDDYQALLDDKTVDIVYIAVPHFYHYEWIIKALKAHKAVLCEKPAVLTKNQMKEVIALAKQENVLFMEAMKTNLVPGFIKIKELVDSGIIGKVQEVSGSFCYKIDPIEGHYLFDPKQGGCIYDTGSYGISFVLNFLGGDVSIKQIDCRKYKTIDTYTKVTLSIGDATGVVTCATDYFEARDGIIKGDKGTIKIKDFYRPVEFVVVNNEGEETLYHVDYENDDFYGEVSHMNTLFLEDKHESDKVTFEHSLRCANVLEIVKEEVQGIEK